MIIGDIDLVADLADMLSLRQDFLPEFTGYLLDWYLSDLSKKKDWYLSDQSCGIPLLRMWIKD